MKQSEKDYLLVLWDLNIRPYCGKKISEGRRVGSGRKTKGGFCSLDCYARYYEVELRERMKRLAEMLKRHQRS